MYKVILKGSEEITPYSEELMGANWLSALEFCNEKVAKHVRKQCEKALKKGWFDTRKKWLGVFYSKEIEKGEHPELIIKWIDERVGYGVFAHQDIRVGTFIGEYTGVVRKRSTDEENFYCFEYAIGDNWKSPFVIDAQGKGNYTRFINHSNTPNAEPVSVYLNGAMHVILIAQKPIRKGEQLCYHYGADYWSKRTHLMSVFH